MSAVGRSWLLAIAAAALGVAYVVHGVAFHPDRGVVVRTWGELRSRPTIAVGTDAWVRIGVGAREFEATDGTLLYLLYEARRPGAAPEILVHVGDQDPVTVWCSGGDEGQTALVVPIVPPTPGQVHVMVEALLPDSDGGTASETLLSLRVQAGGEAPPWTPIPLEWGRAVFDPVTLQNGTGPPSVPVHGAFVNGADDDPLAPLVPRVRRLALRATPDGLVLRGPGIDEPLDSRLIARYRLASRTRDLPALPPLPEELLDADGVLVTEHTVRFDWDFDALGARPGDVVSMEVLWCPNGILPVGKPHYRAQYWKGEPVLRSNPITVVVP